MNYLAHAFLSRHTPDAITGGLLGDFVKGQGFERYPPAVRDAILLHRAIDRFTDAHAIPRASRTLVSPGRRRFAGILVDVFYDHFLARHWSRYSTTALEDFTQQVYATLWPQRASFPERLQRILPHMMTDDWLASYAEIGNVHLALNGIARRFRRFPRAQVLTTAVEELEREYAGFEEHFLAFFPELMRFTQSQLASGEMCVPVRMTGTDP
jgi:acyl carrier protein phosphodiesterase